jgi:DNA primase
MDLARFYKDQLPGSPAAEYLVAERGLSLEDVHRFGVGYSGETEPGHEMYRGRLVIPYLRCMADEWFVVSLKFRRIGDGPSAKYLGDQSPHLYNTVDAIENDHEIAISMGEIDALTASVSGIPSVGVPGDQTWKPVWTPLFLGYERVWVLADGDQSGKDFADRLKAAIGPAVRIVYLPPGMDVNSYAREYGRDALRKLVGR